MLKTRPMTRAPSSICFAKPADEAATLVDRRFDHRRNLYEFSLRSSISPPRVDSWFDRA
ncbi:MAG TPA: hypothetical protein VGC51_05305 [Hansschlegelia sp.]